MVKGPLHQRFIQLLGLEAQHYRYSLTAEPVDLLVLAVSYGNVGEEHSHDAYHNEDNTLHPHLLDGVTECKGDEEGAERKINGDYLVSLALLERELGVSMLVNAR